MIERLTDLDELVLRCRTEQAKVYISEAVACYRIGAFRSCIVATWVAVVYDILHKLDELTLTGDKNAEQYRHQFEEYRKAADISNSLQFERNILDIAKSEFDLLTPMEYEDFQRLMLDRNRCAHPSMNGYDEIYTPTAELTRYHLRNAVHHLLQHPPVQGKAALDRLLQEVQSQYFPTNYKDAIAYFQQGPLLRPRDALTRNFIIVLVKSLLFNEVELTAASRYATALNAVRHMHRQVAENTLDQKLNELVRQVKDEQISQIIIFLVLVWDTWIFLQTDTKTRLTNFISNCKVDLLIDLFIFIISQSSLRKIFISRADKFSESEMRAFIAQKPIAELKDRALVIYSNARSFDHANNIANSIIIPLLEHFDDADIDVLQKIAIENKEIAGSYQLIGILEQLVRLNKIPKQRLNEFTYEIGLNHPSTLNSLIELINREVLEKLAESRLFAWYFQDLLRNMRGQNLITQEDYEHFKARKRLEDFEDEQED